MRNTRDPGPCRLYSYSCAGPSIFHQSLLFDGTLPCKSGCVTPLPSDISVGSPLCALHVAHLLPIHLYEQLAPFIQPLVALLSLGDNGLEPSLAIHFLLLHKSSIESRLPRSLLTFYAFPCLCLFPRILPPYSWTEKDDHHQHLPVRSVFRRKTSTRYSSLQVRGYDNGLIEPFIVSQYARARAPA